MSKTQPPSKDHSGSSAFALLGLALLVVSIFPAVSLIWAMLQPNGGNDFGAHSMLMLAVIIFFAIISPLTATVGAILVYRFARSTTIRVLAGVSALPTSLVLLYLLVSLLTPKPPTYDPQNFQHLVGRNIGEIQSEFDTTGAKTGTSAGDGKTQYLSLRGMDILADEDGTIHTVKQGHR